MIMKKQYVNPVIEELLLVEAEQLLNDSTGDWPLDNSEEHKIMKDEEILTRLLFE